MTMTTEMVIAIMGAIGALLLGSHLRLLFMVGGMKPIVDTLNTIYLVDALREQRRLGNIVSESTERISDEWWEGAKGNSDPRVGARLFKYAKVKKVLPQDDTRLLLHLIRALGGGDMNKGYTLAKERSNAHEMTMQGWLALCLVHVRALHTDLSKGGSGNV